MHKEAVVSMDLTVKLNGRLNWGKTYRDYLHVGGVWRQNTRRINLPISLKHKYKISSKNKIWTIYCRLPTIRNMPYCIVWRYIYIQAIFNNHLPSMKITQETRMPLSLWISLLLKIIIQNSKFLVSLTNFES